MQTQQILTAEEFYRNKAKTNLGKTGEFTLRSIYIDAETAMRWAKEFSDYILNMEAVNLEDRIVKIRAEHLKEMVIAQKKITALESELESWKKENREIVDDADELILDLKAKIKELEEKLELESTIASEHFNGMEFLKHKLLSRENQIKYLENAGTELIKWIPDRHVAKTAINNFKLLLNK